MPASRPSVPTMPTGAQKPSRTRQLADGPADLRDDRTESWWNRRGAARVQERGGPGMPDGQGSVEAELGRPALRIVRPPPRRA